MSKKAISLVFAFLFKSLTICSETLPIELFWQGKTALALKSAQVILDNKNNYSKTEIAYCFDFLADYYFDQGHFEANLKFTNLLFTIKHQTSFDSAFYYARIANYYHCYINPDSTFYFFSLAKKCFKNIRTNRIDSNSIARFYGYLGNASRNIQARNLAFLDSAILYSKNNFTKAINHRKYAIFLTDDLNGIYIRKLKKERINFKKVYFNCINHLKNAEILATSIFPNQKSDLHSRIYYLWSLVERFNQNNALSNRLNDKAKASLIDKNEVFNFFEYAASLHLDASNKLNQYREKKGNIQLVFDAENLLKKSIPYWEGFLKEELKFSSKNFDDRYNLNPYAKLSTVYFELYNYTHKIEYLYKIQGLSDINKNTDNKSNKNKFFNVEFNKQTIIKLQKLSNKKKYAIINYIASYNPSNLMAIVSLPDTTMLILCSGNEYAAKYSFDVHLSGIFIKPEKNMVPKKLFFEAYKQCFKNIDSILQIKRIKNIHIITHSSINGLNFDLAINDTLSNQVFKESSLIKKYNILYHSNSNTLSNYNGDSAIYSSINIIAPNYKKTSYPEIIFGKTLIEKICEFFRTEKFENNSQQVFFKKDKLIQFIGHIKSHEFSNEQMLIINDSENINSNTILNYDLTGSSYLLNGCASNIGKNEMNNKINNLPNYMLNQNATAVISTLWPIDDKENAMFLEKFYDFLSVGLASSEALRQTKLYFSNNNYPPDMWGAYLYYGNDFYLRKKETNYFVIFLSIGIVSIIGMCFYLYKKNKLIQ
jgi:CHAT domain-containing protein